MNTASKFPRLTRRKTIAFTAIAAVAVLVGSGVGLGFSSAAQVAEEDRVRAEALEFSEARRVMSIRMQTGSALAADVTAILTDSAPLLSAGGAPLERVVMYTKVLTALTEVPVDVKEQQDSKTVRKNVAHLERMIENVRTDLPALAATATAAAQARLVAAPLADAALQQAVGGAGAAVTGLDFVHAGSPAAFAGLLASVVAVETSHAAVVEAQRVAAQLAAEAAAAQAAARQGGRGGSSGGGRSTGGGRTGGGTSSGGGYSSGGSTGGGGSVGGGGGGAVGGGGAPAGGGYTNSDAVSAVSSNYGGVAKYGKCVKTNYGTWGRTSTPPAPVFVGTLGWEAGANSDGTGGWVTYYSCA